MTQKSLKNCTLFYNIIALNSNTYMLHLSKSSLIIDASKIELWWHAVQVRLSTHLMVWFWSHCHCGTTSSDDEICRSKSLGARSCE